MGYSVEYAKSNRSTCKGCSSKIAMGDVRIGTTTDGPNGYPLTSWRHLACQKNPKAHTLPSAADLHGYSSLNSDDSALVRAWFAGDQATVQSAKRAADAMREAGAGDPATPKKARRSDARAATPPRKDPASSSSSPAAATVDRQATPTDEADRRAEASALFSPMPITVLKDCLRSNGQLLSGNKLELVERCVDRKLYGNLPRCSKCGIGRLKVTYITSSGHRGQGLFTCPGGYDDDEYVRCSYKSTAEVRPAWSAAEEATFLPQKKSQKRKAPIDVD